MEPFTEKDLCDAFAGSDAVNQAREDIRRFCAWLLPIFHETASLLDDNGGKGHLWLSVPDPTNPYTGVRLSLTGHLEEGRMHRTLRLRVDDRAPKHDRNFYESPTGLLAHLEWADVLVVRRTLPGLLFEMGQHCPKLRREVVSFINIGRQPNPAAVV
ncbi:MAG: hypothetical protein HY092_00530 [Candidatus Kerfeldbacteria bacterium]|nr:hypothetical protein [Candidatus Kerfeldbacteria bacterium]